VTASGVRPRPCHLRSVSPNYQSQVSQNHLEGRRVMFRARAQHGGASSRKQRRGESMLRRLNSSCKPHSTNHRSNGQALRMIFAFRHPLAPTGRRDAGRRRRRLLWSRCDAGAIPCPGKWERDPQAQIRLGAHPRPGERELLLLNRPWGGCASSVPWERS
jgi:hypothetical protein